MTEKQRRRLKLVASSGTARAETASGTIETKASRDLDWTILMARAQDGNPAAYLQLLQDVTPYLRSLVRQWHKDQWDVEDTVQDILLTLHSIRQTYDPSRPFGPWLVGIAHHRAIDRLRRRGRQAFREAPLEAKHEAAVATPHDTEDTLEKHRLEDAIGTLPPIQQKAVNLLKIKEMTLKEASAETGLSIASLKMATHRAIKTLRSMLSSRRDS